jgi:hypothetical protein
MIFLHDLQKRLTNNTILQAFCAYARLQWIDNSDTKLRDKKKADLRRARQ